MNDSQIKSKLKQGTPGKYSIGDGLYFRISNEGTGFFAVRYSIDKKRREITLGKYGKLADGITLSVAKIEAAKIRDQVKKNIDPIAEKKRSQLLKLKTVSQVADDWLKVCDERLENPQIPRRVYNNDIHPAIGELAVTRVNSRDILGIVRKIKESGRPSISNDALIYCKQLFNHAMKLGLTPSNPALSLSIQDAGGTEKSRNRALSFEEVKTVLKCLNEHQDIFTRDNYLATILLLIFGVRKGELIAAKWAEFNLSDKIWMLSEERTKTKAAIKIPIPEQAIPLLEELKIRSCSSEYLFPSRRASKRRAYISDDTLNHALAKMFGLKVDGNKEPYPNILGKAGIEHFVIHDLRRTCRSLLAELGIPPHIAERCLNHKIRGVEGVYDRYDYFEERKVALNALCEKFLDAYNE